MKAVAVEELKNRLSGYLREVKNGEVVLITDRGRVVAELRQPRFRAAVCAHDEVLKRLAAEGILMVGMPQDPRAYKRSPLRAAASDDLLDSERNES